MNLAIRVTPRRLILQIIPLDGRAYDQLIHQLSDANLHSAEAGKFQEDLFNTMAAGGAMRYQVISTHDINQAG